MIIYPDLTRSVPNWTVASDGCSSSCTLMSPSPYSHPPHLDFNRPFNRYIIVTVNKIAWTELVNILTTCMALQSADEYNSAGLIHII